MKKPDRLSQVNRAEGREDQGQKPQGPPGHPGTEILALPDDRRRPQASGTAGRARVVEAEPAVPVIPTDEERNDRPDGAILPLEARQVRVVIPLPVQRQARLRVEDQVLEYFDAGQPNLVRLGSFARRFSTESRVGVRFVVHETESTSRLHSRRVAKLRVLDVVVLGVAVRWREYSEKLVHNHLGVAVAEATSDERLVAVGDGLEHIGLLQDGIVQRLVDVHAEVLPYVKLTLDFLNGTGRLDSHVHQGCQIRLLDDAHDVLIAEASCVQVLHELLVFAKRGFKNARHNDSHFFHVAADSLVNLHI
jgi:hypothetical protein